MANELKKTKSIFAQRKVRIVIVVVGILIIITGIWSVINHRSSNPQNGNNTNSTNTSPVTSYSGALSKVASLRTGRNYEEAHRVLAAFAKTANPDDKCKTYLQMGIFSLTAKNYDRAKTELNVVLADATCKNDSFAALQGLEAVAEQTNDKPALVEYLKKEIAQWPDTDPVRDININIARQQILDSGGQP
ncbi:MAG TPA: hypothetical protein VNX65_03375 [Patescibacteria group bacterium]|nr:hypothetical protein [Patescibacteria group bacterium]